MFIIIKFKVNSIYHSSKKISIMEKFFYYFFWFVFMITYSIFKFCNKLCYRFHLLLVLAKSDYEFFIENKDHERNKDF